MKTLTRDEIQNDNYKGKHLLITDSIKDDKSWVRQLIKVECIDDGYLTFLVPGLKRPAIIKIADYTFALPTVAFINSALGDQPKDKE